MQQQQHLKCSTAEHTHTHTHTQGKELKGNSILSTLMPSYIYIYIYIYIYDFHLSDEHKLRVLEKNHPSLYNASVWDVQK